MKYGKLRPVFPKELRDFSAYTGALPYPASTVHHETGLTYPIDGNDRYGDCVMAGAAHHIQTWNKITNVAEPVPASSTAVVNEYFVLTGGRDSGLVMSDTLNTWRSSGLWGNKIVNYAPVNTKSNLHLRQAINFYGGAFLGMQLPANSETQFSQGQPWSLVSGWQNQKIIGGHAVAAVGYDATYVYVATWGAVQKMTWDWYYVYGDEAWVILPSNDVTAKVGMGGMDYNSLKLDLPGV